MQYRTCKDRSRLAFARSSVDNRFLGILVTHAVHAYNLTSVGMRQRILHSFAHAVRRGAIVTAGGVPTCILGCKMPPAVVYIVVLNSEYVPCILRTVHGRCGHHRGIADEVPGQAFMLLRSREMLDDRIGTTASLSGK